VAGREDISDPRRARQGVVFTVGARRTFGAGDCYPHGVVIGTAGQSSPRPECKGGEHMVGRELFDPSRLPDPEGCADVLGGAALIPWFEGLLALEAATQGSEDGALEIVGHLIEVVADQVGLSHLPDNQ